LCFHEKSDITDRYDIKKVNIKFKMFPDFIKVFIRPQIVYLISFRRSGGVVVACGCADARILPGLHVFQSNFVWSNLLGLIILL
jgi:hypothetical protein